MDSSADLDGIYNEGLGTFGVIDVGLLGTDVAFVLADSLSQELIAPIPKIMRIKERHPQPPFFCAPDEDRGEVEVYEMPVPGIPTVVRLPLGPTV